MNVLAHWVNMHHINSLWLFVCKVSLSAVFCVIMSRFILSVFVITHPSAGSPLISQTFIIVKKSFLIIPICCLFHQRTDSDVYWFVYVYNHTQLEIVSWGSRSFSTVLFVFLKLNELDIFPSIKPYFCPALESHQYSWGNWKAPTKRNLTSPFLDSDISPCGGQKQALRWRKH